VGPWTDYDVHDGEKERKVLDEDTGLPFQTRSRFVTARMTQDETVLKDIGDRCSRHDCKEFDFLQVKCDKCDRVYCKNHILLDLHDCPGRHQTPGDDHPAPNLQKRSGCALEGCTKLSLESFVADAAQTEKRQPAVCPNCGKSFCIE